MEFRILGSFEVVDGDRIVAIPGAKPRALLAMLLARANTVVSAARLIDDLWDGRPPKTAAATLQTYVSQLRRALPAPVVETRASGYVAAVERASVDALRFTDLAGASSFEDLVAALGLWRGAALGDFSDQSWARDEATRLDALRVDTLEEVIGLRLARGDHAALVSELEGLVAEHPFRERLWAEYMRALYRCDRQADALRAYQRVRALLVEELGIEPSPMLSALERDILEQRPELVWSSPDTRSHGLPTGVVTFMLTDVVGSTALWEGDASSMAVKLARHDELVDDAVRVHRGRVLKARGEGDSTFSVFTRATDAFGAALALQRALMTDDALPVRVALHTGEAFERDGDYFGSTVNRAARIRSLAASGQILLSQATGELVRDSLPDDVSLVDLGLHSLVGLSRPERLMAARSPNLRPVPVVPIETLSAAKPSGPLRGLLSEPFVGRAPQLDLLSQLWDGVLAGRAGAVLVSGEPGAGKSRLAAEFAGVVEKDGGKLLYGRCDEALLIPDQPWVEIAEQLALGSAIAATEHADFVRAIDAGLSQVCASVPLALVLDDLQWAAKPTLALVRHVLTTQPERKLLLMAICRSTDLAPGTDLAQLVADLRRLRGERIELAGLPEGDLAGLVEIYTGSEDASTVQPLAHNLSVETDGNPFFAKELLRHLAETGLPSSVRDVVAQRIDRLPSDVGQVLRTAAIIGKEFDIELVASLSDVDADAVLDLLDVALRAALVRELPDRPGWFTFSHALVATALYESVSAARRQRLHVRVGSALEARAAVDVAALAHHFEAAGRAAPDKAARYLYLAGERLANASGLSEAVSAYERALRFIDLCTAPDEALRCDVLIGMAAALAVGREPRSAIAPLERAYAAACSLDSSERLLAVARVIPNAVALAGPTPELVSMLEGIAAREASPLVEAVRTMVRPPPELTGTDELVSRAENSGDPDALWYALIVHFEAQWNRAEIAPVLATGRRLVDESDSAGRLRSANIGRWRLARALLRAADRPSFDAVVSELATFCARSDFPLLSAWLAQLRSAVALSEGDLDAAEACAAAALGELPNSPSSSAAFFAQHLRISRVRGTYDLARGLRSAEARPDTPALLADAALAAAETGDLECASRLFDRVVVPTDMGRMITLRLLAELCCVLGRVDRAPAIYETLSPYDGQLLVGYNLLSVEGAAARGLGQLEAVLGETDAARAHLAAALELESQFGATRCAEDTAGWQERLGLVDSPVRRGVEQSGSSSGS